MVALGSGPDSVVGAVPVLVLASDVVSGAVPDVVLADAALVAVVAWTGLTALEFGAPVQV